MRDKKNWWGLAQDIWSSSSKILPETEDDEFDSYYDFKATWKGKLEDLWWNSVGYRLKELKTSIKNVIRWFPIIWKDRDWDDSYIFTILKQKLYFTAQLHIKNKRYVGWEREVELMTLAIKLIDFVTNEHYEDVAWNFMTSKYGESKWSFKKIEGKEHLSEMIFKYPKIEDGTYTQVEYDKDFRETHNEANTKHRKARKLLFRILDEHIERWWD